MFVPVPLIPVLQRPLADYPNLLAEGGCNFWDVIQLIPVSEEVWYRDLSFNVFPVRHHEHLGAFGIALQGVFLCSGDTRPIPEVVNRYASRGEWIFQDCCTISNPSHTSIRDLHNEYKPEQWKRMVLYRYESPQTGESIRRASFAIAHRGERLPLNRRPTGDQTRDSRTFCRLPGAVGWWRVGEEPCTQIANGNDQSS